MTDFALQHSIPISNEDWAYHRQNMEQAIESGQEGDWHDFKQGIFDDEKLNDLCKDIVALANTIGGPYQGFGYIIIGVGNSGEVIGLQGKDVITEDDRLLRIKNKVQSNIEPYINIQVKEFYFQEKCIHLLVIPQSRLHWHFIRSTQNTSKSYGHWVRRGRSSERPLLDDYAQHTAKVVDYKTQPIKTELAGVKQQLIELRQTIADMKSQTSPESLTPVEFVRTAFTTPERTLLRQARRVVSEYQSKSEARVELFENLSVDQFVDDTESRTSERKQAFKEYFELVESDVRPSIELVAHIIHEAPLQEVVIETVHEVTQSIYQAFIHSLNLSDAGKSIQIYPAHLYLYGVSVSSYYAFQWKIFKEVFLHSRESLDNEQREYRIPLVWCLNKSNGLSKIMEMIGLDSSPCFLHSRVEKLLLQPGWVGETIPVYDGDTKILNGEALLTFGFLCAVAKYTPYYSITMDFRWWKHNNANQILRGMLEKWMERGIYTFGEELTMDAGIILDNIDKSDTKLTERAVRILEKH